MGNRTTTHAIVVTPPAIPANSTPIQLALFGEDGSPFIHQTPQAECQEESDATDLDTLVGEFNALLAKLKSSGLMAES